MRLKRRLALCLGLATLFGGARAEACLNDEETSRHEREFRSNYRRSVAPPAEESSNEPDQSERIAYFGGVVALVGAVVVNPRKRNTPRS
ncbi:MAG: hypothetical protein SFX72_00810 [Isosphaeraceae bacterium]|nr:hypothetical protein [Isosphaeraceae bacterium]